VAGAGIKAINKRIVSVKSTQQITRAMKLVAAAKLRRSQERLMAARPYSSKLMDLLGRLADAGGSSHPLFQQRDIKNRIVIVVTSDKGLCGAYNMNVIRKAQDLIDESVAEGIETSVYAVGRKARDFFAKRGYNVVVSHDDFGGAANDNQARTISDFVTAQFLSGEADDVKLVYAEFVSVMTQRPIIQQCLPIAPPEKEEEKAGNLDYIWEPSKAQLYAVLMPLYLRNRFYIALCEAFASEHGARMSSMSAATQNAGELIDSLTLKRNRERQAAITQELSEIVGGASAL